MNASPEAVWNECLDFIRDNISRQSFRTWFEPLRAVSLDEEEGVIKLTVQLPSRFYYEWLEEHYFALLRKTITKVLGPGARPAGAGSGAKGEKGRGMAARPGVLRVNAGCSTADAHDVVHTRVGPERR